MSSLSVLAASLSHGINNPMAYVSANLRYAIEELREIGGELEGGPTGKAAERLAEVVQALSQAEDGARRITDLVRRLEAFGDMSCQRNGPVDVRNLLESLVSLIGCEFSQHASFTAQLGEVPPVAGPRAEIARDLLEMLVKAVQAVRDKDCEPSEIRFRTWTDADGSAAVEVSAAAACGFPTRRPEIVEPGLEGLRGVGGSLGESKGELVSVSETRCDAAFELRLPPIDVSSDIPTHP
jgi:nitrogen-specific signal transduction histidine kinase